MYVSFKISNQVLITDHIPLIPEMDRDEKNAQNMQHFIDNASDFFVKDPNFLEQGEVWNNFVSQIDNNGTENKVVMDAAESCLDVCKEKLSKDGDPIGMVRIIDDIQNISKISDENERRDKIDVWRNDLKKNPNPFIRMMCDMFEKWEEPTNTVETII